mmetsp:Transcript_1273/g.2764  ORF Transcript_1273/g.2764 Transcript_1273/m.2764 type:complete len:231 (-) Transcript_1273:1210-1902(-)
MHRQADWYPTPQFNGKTLDAQHAKSHTQRSRTCHSSPLEVPARREGFSNEARKVLGVLARHEERIPAARARVALPRHSDGVGVVADGRYVTPHFLALPGDLGYDSLRPHRDECVAVGKAMCRRNVSAKEAALAPRLWPVAPARLLGAKRLARLPLVDSGEGLVLGGGDLVDRRPHSIRRSAVVKDKHVASPWQPLLDKVCVVLREESLIHPATASVGLGVAPAPLDAWLV